MTNVTLKDFTYTSGFDLHAIEDLLRKNGAVLLPKWIVGQTLDNLRADWDAIRAERNNDSVECVIKAGGDLADYASLYRSKPKADQFKHVNQVFNDDRIVQLTKRVVGQPCLLNEEVYATYDVGNDEEIAPSHFDKLWNLKFMIYLEDILEPGYGAFGVHPGSQVLARKQFRDWFASNSKNDAVEVGTSEYYEMENGTLPENLSEFVEILAPAGSMIIFSTDVFHRGGYLKKGAERKILRSHSCPGYKSPGNGDIIRKNSRQWLRGEPWELRGEFYNRFSKDGWFEWKNHMNRRMTSTA